MFGIVATFFTASGIRFVDFFYLTNHGISALGLPGLMTYFGNIALITVQALTFGKRGMCHSICWMAPPYGTWYLVIGSSTPSFSSFTASSGQLCEL